MELLQRLKEVLPGETSSTTTYSITVCRCTECGTTFESRTAPEHAYCPDCESTDVEPATAEVDR